MVTDGHIRKRVDIGARAILRTKAAARTQSDLPEDSTFPVLLGRGSHLKATARYEGDVEMMALHVEDV